MYIKRKFKHFFFHTNLSFVAIFPRFFLFFIIIFNNTSYTFRPVYEENGTISLKNNQLKKRVITMIAERERKINARFTNNYETFYWWENRLRNKTRCVYNCTIEIYIRNKTNPCLLYYVEIILESIGYDLREPNSWHVGRWNVENTWQANFQPELFSLENSLHAINFSNI